MASIQHKITANLVKKDEDYKELIKKSETYLFCKGVPKSEGKKPSEIISVQQSNTLSSCGAAPTYVEKALHAQAHWFIYAQMAPPFSAFKDLEFREMLRSMVLQEPGYMKVKWKPILSVEKLNDYIDAE